MTRVVCDVGQPRRMETCGAEEPYEGNLHVRFCGGIGRAIANPTRTADCLQRPLLRRSRFRQRLSASVRHLAGQDQHRPVRLYHIPSTWEGPMNELIYASATALARA